jgi:uncharacterized protein
VSAAPRSRSSAPARRSPSPAPAGLLLTPGAGASRDQPALLAIEDALRPQRILVERMDFPYRKAGRRNPDREPVLLQAVRDGAEPLRRKVRVLAIGGRSMGGRVCSIAVAQGLEADALVLISYPLHAPGRPDRVRADHFPALSVPCLFVSGTRDAFGRPEELEDATAAIPGPVTHQWVEGGDHGLRGGDARVAALVKDWLSELLAASAPAGQ